MTDIRSWIGLSIVPDIGPVAAKKLVAAFGGPENVFSAPAEALLSVEGIGRERADRIRNFDLWKTAERIAERAEGNGIRIVCLDDPAYPQGLKELDGPPIVLYMSGIYIPEDRFAVAVVGSRRNTPYGEAVTRKISGELADAGFTIVSGLARGIDSIAHKSAVESGGRTVAVLGSGPDVIYPIENRGLASRIISGAGCIMSEFPPGSEPARENFPRRNRLISGLSLGVLVVEATEDSGSLITARYALEQNREVFAVPGNIDSDCSMGTNLLIRQGASMALETDDVIRALAPMLRGFMKKNERPAQEVSDEERGLCSLLSREPTHIDQLTRESALPVQQMLALLLSLEMKGIVRQTSGKRFYLA